MAFECHVSTQLKIYPPASGAHDTHRRVGLGCGSCHHAYGSNLLHKNGFINGYNWTYATKTPGEIVAFGPDVIPTPTFDHAAGTCSGTGTACHGATTPDWYSGSACGSCHSLPPLNQYPPTTGAHAVHRYNKLLCQTCHYQYTTTPAYPHDDGNINGSILDPIATVTGITIVYFDPARTTGSWNVGTADCTGLGCHGDKNWYAYPNTSKCSACHRFPPLNQGTPRTGRHGTHEEYPCSRCHNNYALSDPLHNDGDINGSNLDPKATATPFNIVIFSSGSGSFDPGLANCEGLGGGCHGPENWYDDD